MDTCHRTRRDATAAQWRIYVTFSRPLNTNVVVHTGGFATLDREIPFDSYITVTAFVRELRILAERFPTLLPSERLAEDRITHHPLRGDLPATLQADTARPQRDHAVARVHRQP